MLYSTIHVSGQVLEQSHYFLEHLTRILTFWFLRHLDEVWKRDFEDQWGFAYPGAAWDFSEGAKKKEKKRITYQAPDSSDSDVSESFGRSTKWSI